MTTTSPTITALCAAIDAGDDSLLPILADALEEVGDSRAAGLRRKLPPPENLGRWSFDDHCPFAYSRGYCEGSDRQWLRLTDLAAGRTGPWLLWRTSSAAYLALAAALTETHP